VKSETRVSLNAVWPVTATFLSTRRAYAELGWVRYTRAVKFSHAIKPAGWFASALLFGVPALVFAFLFHWLGPHLVQRARHGGASSICC
jgi:hypothetical protein